MSAARILALAQMLHAAREQATAVQNELLHELHADPAIDFQRNMCYLVDPERRVWSLSWNTGHVHIQQIPALDVQEPAQRNGVRSAEELLDF